MALIIDCTTSSILDLVWHTANDDAAVNLTKEGIVVVGPVTMLQNMSHTEINVLGELTDIYVQTM